MQDSVFQIRHNDAIIQVFDDSPQQGVIIHGNSTLRTHGIG